MFRKKSEKEYQDKLNGLQQKFAEGTTALQHSIGGVTNQVASQVEKVRRSISYWTGLIKWTSEMNAVTKKSASVVVNVIIINIHVIAQ